MKITEFNKAMTDLEGGPVQVNIAQMGEVVRRMRNYLLEKTGGFFDLYWLIRQIK